VAALAVAGCTKGQLASSVGIPTQEFTRVETNAYNTQPLPFRPACAPLCNRPMLAAAYGVPVERISGAQRDAVNLWFGNHPPCDAWCQAFLAELQWNDWARAGDTGAIVHVIEREFGGAGGSAVNVAHCESRLDPWADGGAYKGLFQMNLAIHGDLFDGPWYDPVANTTAAKRLYDAAGWSPWGCRG
jgi:hypothetical protein